MNLKDINWDKLTFKEFQTLEMRMQQNPVKKKSETLTKNKVSVSLDGVIYTISQVDYKKLKSFKKQVPYDRFKNFLKIKYKEIEEI